MMLRAIMTIGAVQAASMLVLIGRAKILALLLGPEQVGIMAVIDKLLLMIAQTASLSLPFAALRFLPDRWSAGPAAFRELYAPMRNLCAGLGVTATIAALAVTWWIPSLWGDSLLPYRHVLAVAMAGLPVLALAPFLQNAFAARFERDRAMLFSLLHALVLLAATAGIAWYGLISYYALYAVLGLALVVAGARRAAGGSRARPPVASPTPAALPAGRLALCLPAQLWRFMGALALPAFGAPYAALFVHYRVLTDHGAKAAGCLQAAIAIALALRIVLGSAHGVFLTPNVNRGGKPIERMEWANRFQITLCLVAGLTVPPLLLFPDLAVRLLYSVEFLPGAAFVVLFALTEIIGLLSGTYQSLVVAFDHLRPYVAINLAAQAAVVTIATLTVDRLGLLGAGLACLAAPVVLLAGTMLFLRRRYGLAMPGAVVARSGWLLVAIAGAGLIGNEFTGLDPFTLLLKAATLAVVGMGFGILLTEHERRRVRALLGGRGV